jgi:hypothetical protein
VVLLFESREYCRGPRNVRRLYISASQPARRVFIDHEFEGEIELIGNARLVENPRVKRAAE